LVPALAALSIKRRDHLDHTTGKVGAVLPKARREISWLRGEHSPAVLGVMPLVTATGAGANARQSLGISVFSGMIASTCLAVLFVPSFFVIMQRLEERRRGSGTGAAEVKTSPVGVAE
jgi:HAE1 family hydrophobic/amphiphilic exporter-1